MPTWYSSVLKVRGQKFEIFTHEPDVSVALTAAINALAVEQARQASAGYREALRALVASLPRCDACAAPATRAFGRGGARWCDAHGPASPYLTDYPRAAPLRAAVKLLGGSE